MSTPAFVLPDSGEMLITDRQVAGALGTSRAKPWELLKSDPEFPKPVRRGSRFTRWKASELRTYIAKMGEVAA